MFIQNSSQINLNCQNPRACMPRLNKQTLGSPASEVHMNKFTFSVGSILTGLGGLMLGHPILKNSISPTTGRTLMKVGRLLSSISREEGQIN